jgi:hypothetical protein
MDCLAEVEHGRLATQNASSPDIKQFAQRMVEDYSKAGDELKGLASQKDVTLATKLERQHRAMQNNLAKLKGALRQGLHGAHGHGTSPGGRAFSTGSESRPESGGQGVGGENPPGASGTSHNGQLDQCDCRQGRNVAAPENDCRMRRQQLRPLNRAHSAFTPRVRLGSSRETSTERRGDRRPIEAAHSAGSGPE